MFYAHYVLSKKGPLARIWLAAHWDKKLTRNHVFDTNISSSVEAILQPQVKLALRTSGHLLLGVARIYSRQAKYLLADCNEAFVKIKMAFRPGVENTGHELGHNDDVLAAITLQENMKDFESTLADLNDINETQHVAMNQSRVEDITMREEFGEVNLGRPDDDFGDGGFALDVSAVNIPVPPASEDVDNDAANADAVAEVAISEAFGGGHMPPSVSMLNDDEFGDANDDDDDNYDSGHNLAGSMPVTPAPATVDEGGVGGGENIVIEDATVSNARNSLFQDTTLDAMSTAGVAGVAETTGVESDLLQLDSTLGSMGGSGEPNLVATAVRLGAELATLPEEEGIMAKAAEGMQVQHNRNRRSSRDQQQQRNVTDFVLPPLRDDAGRAVEHKRGPKRKRRSCLLIDEHKSIPSEVMKLQMQDTNEITTRLDLAPPTRKLMHWKESGSAEALLATPGRAIPSRILQRLFYRNMKTRSIANDAPDGLPLVLTEEQKQQQEQEAQEQGYYDDDDDGGGAPFTPGAVSNHASATGAHCGQSEYSAVYDVTHSPLFIPSATEQAPNQTDIVEKITVEKLNSPLDQQNQQPQPEPQLQPEQQPQKEQLQQSHSHLEMPSFSTLDEVERGRETMLSSTIGLSAGITNESLQSVRDISQAEPFPPQLDSVGMTGGLLNSPEAPNQNKQLQEAIQALDSRMDGVDKEFKNEMTSEGLERRSEAMSSVLLNALKQAPELVFQDLTVSNNKKQAASKFYTLLLLGRRKVIQLRQESPFSNIIITSYSATGSQNDKNNNSNMNNNENSDIINTDSVNAAEDTTEGDFADFNDSASNMEAMDVDM